MAECNTSMLTASPDTHSRIYPIQRELLNIHIILCLHTRSIVTKKSKSSREEKAWQLNRNVAWAVWKNSISDVNVKHIFSIDFLKLSCSRYYSDVGLSYHQCTNFKHISISKENYHDVLGPQGHSHGFHDEYWIFYD